MTLQELIAKRAKAWEAAKSFLDSHRSENGTLSAEDDQTYARMEADITDLTKEIERTQRLENFGKQMSLPIDQPLVGKPLKDPKDQKTGRASRQYVEDMLTAMRTRFRQVTDFLNEGTDSSGGYLVPDEWDSRLIDILKEENILRGKATVIKTSGEHKINIAGTKPAASWIEEGGALNFDTSATFSQIVLDAHKLHVAIKVTEELLYDNAFGLENYILTQFGAALANAEEDAFLNGDGTGKPLGIFATTGGGQYSTEAASAAIKSDDLIDLVYHLKRPYRKNAEFIMADKTIASVRKLKDTNGAYIWQPSYQAGEPDRILGYPVNTSAYAPELEAGKGGIAFGDFSYYNIGDRGTRSVQELRELFAGNGMIGYVMKERVDGKLVLPEAVQILSVKGA